LKTYDLHFHEDALKEWERLDATVRRQFTKKLTERLKKPRVKSAKLGGMGDAYKVKLVASGYRLIYQVIDDELIVLVIAIGKREANAAYRKAHTRLT
jgi:mRNA interferase RelE/StbE